MVSSAVHVLEAQPLENHALAVLYLRKLLRSKLLPASRPRWWERLSVDLGHHGNLNQPAEAWLGCRNALMDPYFEPAMQEAAATSDSVESGGWTATVLAPEYAQIRRRFLKLSTQLKRSPEITRYSCGDEPPYGCVSI